MAISPEISAILLIQLTKLDSILSSLRTEKKDISRKLRK
jgi:hypothetical protein